MFPDASLAPVLYAGHFVRSDSCAPMIGTRPSQSQDQVTPDAMQKIIKGLLPSSNTRSRRSHRVSGRDEVRSVHGRVGACVDRHALHALSGDRSG